MLRAPTPNVPGMLRVGFVGSGLIAWAHGLGLRAMIDGGVLDASIVAVHDEHERRARGFADVLGDSVEVVADAAEVARRCDAIWVCTPTSAHRIAVDAALAAGCAVFCEKPLDVDLTRATGLVEAVGASGGASQSGLVLRSAPVFRALRELVRGGTIGAPMAAIFRDDQYFPIQGTYASQWRADVAQAGGGCLIEHSIHDLDILRFCFGEVESVMARTANHAGHDGVEDLAVFCREGMVWLDDEFRGPLHLQTSAGTEVRACPSPPWVDALPLADDEVGVALRAYVEADRGFADAVIAGRPPEPGLEVALQAHRLVDAAYRSAAGGGAPIGLPPTRG
jgi:predicted dehydrogenase